MFTFASTFLVGETRARRGSIDSGPTLTALQHCASMVSAFSLYRLSASLHSGFSVPGIQSEMTCQILPVLKALTRILQVRTCFVLGSSELHLVDYFSREHTCAKCPSSLSLLCRILVRYTIYCGTARNSVSSTGFCAKHLAYPPQ